MRKLLPLLFLPLLAACVGDPISVTPTSLDLAVGQNATILVARQSSNGMPTRTSTLNFTGTGAISAVGTLPQNAQTTQILVQAVRPGIGYVYLASSTSTVATVNVFDCATAPTLTPGFSSLEAKIGEQVVMKPAASQEGGTFQWYSGPRGDTSHPIPLTNTPYYIDFAPRANGTYLFWVRQTTPCGPAEAAYAVNVGTPHRRPVGR